MQSSKWEEEERAQVLSLVRAVPKAIERKDVKEILEIYDTHNPKFCTFEDDPDYLERVNGSTFRKFVGGLAKLDSSSIDRKDLKVDFLARNVALVTGIDDWTSRKDDKVIGGRSRFTILLQKNRKWRVVHEHFTKIK
jgi:ketosteroid isomerase-like protein